MRVARRRGAVLFVFRRDPRYNRHAEARPRARRKADRRDAFSEVTRGGAVGRRAPVRLKREPAADGFGRGRAGLRYE